MKPRPVLVASLLAIAGCSKPAIHVVKAAAPELPSGWTLYDDTEDKMKIGIPSGWRQGVDSMASGLQLANGIADAPSSTMDDPNNPVASLGRQMQADDAAQQKEALAKLREKGIVINVIDGSKPTPGEARTSFYVKKIDHDGNWSLEGARDDEVEYFRGWGAAPPKLVKLPIGPAYRFASDYKTRGGDEVERVSYVVVDGKQTYCLRFISTNNPQAVLSIEDAVSKTWRITPGQ